MITVFHNNNFIAVHYKLVIRDPVYIFLSELVPVAIAHTNTLDTALTLVQHQEQRWYQNCQVTTINRSRSTSVGDVMKKDGSYWLVTMNSFKELKTDAEKANKILIPIP